MESNLVPKMQNPNETYTYKYQNHVACSYGYKLESVDDRFNFLSHIYVKMLISLSLV